MLKGRLRRVSEAIEYGRVSAHMDDIAASLTNDINLTGLEKFKRITMKCLAYTASHLPPEQRLQRIENWGKFLLSDEGLKVLALEFEKVTQKEAELQELEDKLYESKAIELNENMFRALCAGDLIPGKMDLVSMPSSAPLYASTPQRKVQTITSEIPTTSKAAAAAAAGPSPTSSTTSSTTSSSSLSRIPMPHRMSLATARSTTPLSSLVPEIPPYINALLKKYNNTEMVPIGPNGTLVNRKALISINWSQSVANVTRKLLMEVFDRETLASHTLSGKPSPAFLGCNKPIKHQLDEKKVKDLTHVLTSSLTMTEKEVRQAITTKCADENKMWRQRMQKIMAIKSKENRIKN